MGSRTKDNATAVEWADGAGPTAHHGTFADAAAFGEVVVNAVGGRIALAVLRSAGEEHLDGKVLLDVSNPWRSRTASYGCLPSSRTVWASRSSASSRGPGW